MNPALPGELGLIVVFVFANCIIAAPLIKLFAQTLRLREAFLIAIVAFGSTSIGLATYFVLKVFLALPKELDGAVTGAALVLAGWLTTMRAKKYGVRKVGWLGVGAKTVLTLVIGSWLLFAINLATHIFM